MNFTVSVSFEDYLDNPEKYRALKEALARALETAATQVVTEHNPKIDAEISVDTSY